MAGDKDTQYSWHQTKSGQMRRCRHADGSYILAGQCSMHGNSDVSGANPKEAKANFEAKVAREHSNGSSEDKSSSSMSKRKQSGNAKPSTDAKKTSDSRSSKRKSDADRNTIRTKEPYDTYMSPITEQDTGNIHDILTDTIRNGNIDHDDVVKMMKSDDWHERAASVSLSTISGLNPNERRELANDEDGRVRAFFLETTDYIDRDITEDMIRRASSDGDIQEIRAFARNKYMKYRSDDARSRVIGAMLTGEIKDDKDAKLEIARHSISGTSDAVEMLSDDPDWDVRMAANARLYDDDEKRMRSRSPLATSDWAYRRLSADKIQNYLNAMTWMDNGDFRGSMRRNHPGIELTSMAALGTPGRGNGMAGYDVKSILSSAGIPASSELRYTYSRMESLYDDVQRRNIEADRRKYEEEHGPDSARSWTPKPYPYPDAREVSTILKAWSQGDSKTARDVSDRNPASGLVARAMVGDIIVKYGPNELKNRTFYSDRPFSNPEKGVADDVLKLAKRSLRLESYDPIGVRTVHRSEVEPMDWSVMDDVDDDF